MEIFRIIYQSFATLLSSFKGSPMLLDGFRVLVAGTFFEFSRRTATSILNTFTDSFFLTAIISDNDEAYDWISHYLSIHAPIVHPPNTSSASSSSHGSHPKSKAEYDDRYSIKTNLIEAVWPTGRAAPRHVSIAARRPRNSRRSMPGYEPWRDPYESEDDIRREEEEDKDALLHVEPTLGITQYVKYQGKTVKFHLQDEGYSVMPVNQRKWMVMSAFLGTHELFTSLLQAARKEYLAELPKRTIAIYSPEHGSNWFRSSSRAMRPWESIILPPGVKEWLLADATEFLAEREFYDQRGVPHRRGYLLYGEPGSGKSSLISALAAQLKLDIYIVNLGSKFMDDDNLSTLLQGCPSRCILLMEDIDCAFKTRKSDSKDTGKSQEKGESEGSTEKTSDEQNREPENSNYIETGVTLSGLLNALDGVASSEGRLLFCTTNWKDKIDPALSRPGRCDVWIEFTHATQDQARDLFIHFFHRDFNPSVSSTDLSRIPPASNSISGTNSSKSSSNLPSELSSLAEKFASAIPKDKVSVSALQGYLVRYKRKPQQAADEAEDWVKGGFGQGPTVIMNMKDGLLEIKEIKSEDDHVEDQSSLETSEDKKKDHMVNGNGNGKNWKGVSVNGKGIEHLPNGHATGTGNGDSIRSEGILRRARTHMRALSRSKNGSDS